MKVGDIFEKDGNFEIITSIEMPGQIDKMPLKDYVMSNYMINHNGSYISIRELVNEIMKELINKED